MRPLQGSFGLGGMAKRSVAMRGRCSAFMLAIASAAPWAHSAEFVFDTPSDDRWHYPFNLSSPGRRPFASCFGSTADPNYTTFNDRDGIFLIAWRPGVEFCGGLPAGAYDVRQVRVTLTAQANTDWPIDLSVDPWFNLDYPVSDTDAGQPLELFGLGFGPQYTYANWVETSLYIGGDDQEFTPRDPFPFVFDSVGAKLHVEDSVKNQFTPAPWAVGSPVGYIPGNQSVPFPVHFDVNLSFSQGRVKRYFEEQLSGGRVAVAVTSLTVTFEQAPSGFPSFYTKEGAALDPAADAPRLEITLAASADPDGDLDRDKKDWAALADCLAGPETPPAADGDLTEAQCLCMFDFDQDADIDFFDAAEFARAMGRR